MTVPSTRAAACLMVATLASLASYRADAAETVTYTYDAQGRLVEVTHGGDVNDGAKATYSFDDADNRTNVTIVNGASRTVTAPVLELTIIPVLDP